MPKLTATGLVVLNELCKKACNIFDEHLAVVEKSHEVDLQNLFRNLLHDADGSIRIGMLACIVTGKYDQCAKKIIDQEACFNEGVAYWRGSVSSVERQLISLIVCAKELCSCVENEEYISQIDASALAPFISIRSDGILPAFIGPTMHDKPDVAKTNFDLSMALNHIMIEALLPTDCFSEDALIQMAGSWFDLGHFESTQTKIMKWMGYNGPDKIFVNAFSVFYYEHKVRLQLLELDSEPSDETGGVFCFEKLEREALCRHSESFNYKRLLSDYEMRTLPYNIISGFSHSSYLRNRGSALCEKLAAMFVGNQLAKNFSFDGGEVSLLENIYDKVQGDIFHGQVKDAFRGLIDSFELYYKASKNKTKKSFLDLLIKGFKRLYKILDMGVEKSVSHFEILDRINNGMSEGEVYFDEFVALCEDHFPGLLPSEDMDGYVILRNMFNYDDVITSDFESIVSHFSLRGIIVRAAQLVRACILQHDIYIHGSESDTHGRLGVVLAKAELSLVTLLPLAVAKVDWGCCVLVKHLMVKRDVVLAAMPKKDRQNDWMVSNAMAPQFLLHINSTRLLSPGFFSSPDFLEIPSEVFNEPRVRAYSI